MAEQATGKVVRDQIESAARMIAKNLHGRGEVPLAQLQQESGVDSRIFDWAIGWLLKDDEIEVRSSGAAFSVLRKEPDTSAPVFI